MEQAAKPERGLRHWMERVVKEAEKAGNGFEADPVHDLRVAIRRCRSMADGFRMLDPHPAWKKMRKSAKALFSALGDLRDVQVQMEWVQKLGVEIDPVRDKLITHFQEREQFLKNNASAALSTFDTQQWLAWADDLDPRVEQVSIGGDAFQVIALERWIEAHRLHGVAMKNRTAVSLHALRIGIKKFRYIVENFLPELHEAWIKDLKSMQDVLGEIHDLDVLAATARQIRAYANPEQRAKWQNRIVTERSTRLDKYRAKMLGRDSLWTIWRNRLPQGEGLKQAILKKFEIWAFLREDDHLHTENVLHTSLKLYDSLISERLLPQIDFEGVSQRDLLTIAVLGHEAGRLGNGKHYKVVVKIFERLDVPPGWSELHLRIAGLVARYHKGAPPADTHAVYRSLAKSAKNVVNRLAGIIRLADAVVCQRNGAGGEIEVNTQNGAIVVSAVGLPERTREAERIAAARHLLESVSGVPILVRASLRTAKFHRFEN
ncbi:MAG TPA: CHAD domain-containing protein [Terriglobales bacterium]|nr:CHAD domain-containing protein [Terriglobales bacterium]